MDGKKIMETLAEIWGRENGCQMEVVEKEKEGKAC